MSEQKLRAALLEIAERCENHPLYCPEMAEQLMRDDFTLAMSIGGDSAEITGWAATARKALEP